MSMRLPPLRRAVFLFDTPGIASGDFFGGRCARRTLIGVWCTNMKFTPAIRV
jgi:hypothetical protein